MMTRHASLALLAAASLALVACGGGGHKQSTGFNNGGGNGAGGNANGAGVGAAGESTRTTFLLSKAADGGFPNGPSRNATVSHDQRIARYIAYESDASNIVGGDANNATDIFLVFRAQPSGGNGTPWVPAGTQLISKGPGGAPANGPSYRPDVDGDSHHT